ncbi:MAG: hypothetical protein HN380_16920 [Victivallales bacterium]|nr:hypothetical protein [Victivallales bacterium]
MKTCPKCYRPREDAIEICDCGFHLTETKGRVIAGQADLPHVRSLAGAFGLRYAGG